MKHIIIALMILLAGCSVASADSGFGITDALSDIVKNGIDKFVIGCADNMYEQGYAPVGKEVFNGTSTEIFIYSLTTRTIDPWAKEGITNFMKKSLLILVIYCFIYSIVGAIYVLLSMLLPTSADLIDTVLNRSSAFRAARIKEYFGNLLVSITVVAFTNTIMIAFFTVNFFMVSFLIVSCFDATTLSPSGDNAILYLSMAIFYAVLGWFMLVREVLLCIFVASGFIIGALLISNKTRDFGLSVGYYFIGILFLQTIIVGITTIGFVAVESIKTDSGIVAGSVSEICLYFVLLGILLWATIKMMFGLKRHKKRIMKLVI